MLGPFALQTQAPLKSHGQRFHPMGMRSSYRTKQGCKVSLWASRCTSTYHCTFHAHPLTSLVLQGKERNFSHRALFVISLAVYYRNSQKLVGASAEFQEYFPEAAVVLVAAGVSFGFMQFQRQC